MDRSSVTLETALQFNQLARNFRFGSQHVPQAGGGLNHEDRHLDRAFVLSTVATIARRCSVNAYG
jgi:hypothetical protein